MLAAHALTLLADQLASDEAISSQAVTRRTLLGFQSPPLANKSARV